MVENHVRDGGKRTDAEIAKLFCCCRQTVIAWRKKYPEFQKAIDSPNARINAKVNRNIEAMLDEGTICIVEDGNGKVKKKVKTQLAPEAVNAAIKAGFGGANTFNEREQKQRDAELTRAIRLRMQKYGLSYLDAVAECEEEGVTVRESWKTREIARIIGLKEARDLDAVQAVLRLEASGLEVPKLLMLEAQKSLGVVGNDAVQPAIIKIVSPGAYIDDDRSD